MTRPIINIADVELQPRPERLTPKGAAAERFDARMGLVGQAIGTKQLGCNVTAVPPGMRAFPCHNHRINEELFIVLEGEGEVRIGDDTYPIRSGDIISCPAGGRESAHQIINTGDAEMKFLAISTKQSPEIVEYPDSNKFGVLAEFPPDGDGQPSLFRFIGREEQALDYWDGE